MREHKMFRFPVDLSNDEGTILEQIECALSVLGLLLHVETSKAA